MASKGFVCEAEINLHLLSTLGNHECPSQLVFLTIEIMGKVHKTKPQHAYYPLVFNETIQLEKTFWSPANEDEVVDMLGDSQVIIELRRIDSCFYNGLLLAYFDGCAKDLLFSGYPKIPCSTNGKEIYLNRTIDFKGTTPRLRYSAFADVKRIGGNDSIETNTEKYNSIQNRSDDGYYSPSQSLKQSNYKSLSRRSRSPKRSGSPAMVEQVSSPYYTRQTVASAIRSRSPSPNYNRSTDNYPDKENIINGDSGNATEKSKEPFVVRKVPDNLIGRHPKLHDNLPKDVSRRGRSRRQQSVTRTKDNLGSNVQTGAGKRVRSVSPTKTIERSLSSVNFSDNLDDKLTSYKPSTFTSNFRSSFDNPHFCYDCPSRCHSPYLDCYRDRLARFSHCLTGTHGCRSHCCHWVSDCYGRI